MIQVKLDSLEEEEQVTGKRKEVRDSCRVLSAVKRAKR
jgi:hypothetical protein